MNAMRQGGFSVRDQRVVVVGAAKSGIAAAELLVKRGATVTLSEQQESFNDIARLQALGVTVETGGHRTQTLLETDLIVTSPGVPMDQPVFNQAREKSIEIIGELELAWRWLKGPVIAITGTKGKSTTTTLVSRILQAGGREVLVGGNIGIPLSAQVENSQVNCVHVIETSSFQLETTTTFHPWIAVWLNVSMDHLDRHPSFQSYVDAKTKIFSNQDHNDTLIINADDPQVKKSTACTKSRCLTFSLSGSEHADFVVSGDWIVRRTTTGEKPLLPLAAVELTGFHMLNNVLAAAAATYAAGMEDSEAIVSALHGFRGLEHVMEPVGSIQCVRFVNDSKATNVEAALRSIESFTGNVVAILGGRYKGGDFRELRGPLAANGKGVIAIGEATSLIREALSDLLPVIEVHSMKEAVEAAYKLAKPEGVVLLTPACASFDWFTDYAGRGRAFKEAITSLDGDMIPPGGDEEGTPVTRM